MSNQDKTTSNSASGPVSEVESDELNTTSKEEMNLVNIRVQGPRLLLNLV